MTPLTLFKIYLMQKFLWKINIDQPLNIENLEYELFAIKIRLGSYTDFGMKFSNEKSC